MREFGVEPDGVLRRAASCPTFFTYVTSRTKPLLVIDCRLLLLRRGLNLDRYRYELNLLMMNNLQCINPGLEDVVVLITHHISEYFSDQIMQGEIYGLLRRVGFDGFYPCDSPDALESMERKLCQQHICTPDKIELITADKDLQDFVRNFITRPDVSIGELNRDNLQHVTKERFAQLFLLCLDIDETLLDLPATISAGDVVLNPHVICFIKKLLRDGHQFEVYFVTARWNVREVRRRQLENGFDIDYFDDILRQISSVPNVEEAFKNAFPNVTFHGTRYSGKDIVEPDGEMSFKKYFILRQLARVHDRRVLFLENSKFEIEYVQQRDPNEEQVTCVQCYDYCKLMDDQLEELTRKMTTEAASAGIVAVKQ